MLFHNTHRKTFTGLLALLVCTFCMGGCADEETLTPDAVQESSLTTQPEGQTAAYAQVRKPESISWLSHDGLDPEDGQQQWDAEFERFTGIDLRHEYINGNEYNQRIRFYNAAGTLPDVFDLSYTYYPLYAADGALADLTDLVKASGLYDQVDPELWRQVTFDGKIYGVPREMPQACGTYVRKDWLDRLHMDIPTTYEEFITMLERFRDEIDECLVPYATPGLVTASFMPEFYLGASADIICVDGIWVDGMQQPEMITAMENIQYAYTHELLDMEAMTNTTSVCRDGWMAGSTGCICYWAGNWGQKLVIGLQDNVPEAEVVWIPPIEGATYLFGRPTVNVINGKLSEEQTAQVFKYFIHYMHDGGEGQTLFEFGVEGVHWQRNADHVEMIFDPSSSSSLDNVLNKAYVLPSSRLTPLQDNTLCLEYDASYIDSIAVIESVAKPQYFQPSSPTYNEIYERLDTLRKDCIAQIVTGGISVEEGLAQYAEGARQLGLDQALAEMNAMGSAE